MSVDPKDFWEKKILTWEEGRTAQMWALPCPDLNRIVVRLRRGEEMTDDDARDVLRLVEEAVTA